MNKIAVIYWSQTGNTETMATAIMEGATEAGAEVEVIEVSNITVQKAVEYEKIALGCPSMGVEVLEEDEFEPFFEELEDKLKGKKVALFGSYGWGEGQWMRDWQERTKKAGAKILNGEGLIINETPDDEGLAKCKQFGKEFSNF